MYIYMGMFFNSPQDVPDFGSIKMYFVGTKDLGYVEEGNKRYRKYAFQSADISKLSLITNALDGSEAFAVDTGTTYVLYDGQWKLKRVSSSSAIEQAIEGITSIDYQVVQSLPNSGNKGIIYLVGNNEETGNVFDEYIWTGSTFEKIGTTETDLTNYPTFNEDYFRTLEINGNKYPTGIIAASNAELDQHWPEIPLYTVVYDKDQFKLQMLVDKSNHFYDSQWIDLTGIITPLGDIEFGDDFNNNEFLATYSTSGVATIKRYFCDASRVTTHSISNMPSTITTGSLILEILPGGSSFAGDDITVQRILCQNGDIYQRVITKDSRFEQVISYTGWEKIFPITYAEATTSTAGLMSASDKTKLDSIPVANLLTSDDIIVCTQAEYDAIQTKTGLIYLIKES